MFVRVPVLLYKRGIVGEVEVCGAQELPQFEGRELCGNQASNYRNQAHYSSHSFSL